MKLNIQTKDEKNNMIGLLLAGNFVGTSICFLLLVIQFLIFPEGFGIIWTFVLAIVTAMAWFNLKFFRSYYKTSALWKWLKNHQ